MGRRTNVDYAGTTPDLTYTYDAGSQLTGSTDGVGSSTFAYDPVGRLSSFTRSRTGGATDTVGYGWDPASQLLSRSVAANFRKSPLSITEIPHVLGGVVSLVFSVSVRLLVG